VQLLNPGDKWMKKGHVCTVERLFLQRWCGSNDTCRRKYKEVTERIPEEDNLSNR
jgi:hypothetical protein